jgi:mannose-6-phosphate isomerase-like protein (cupin superfamily)
MRITLIAAGLIFAAHAGAQNVPAGVVLFDSSKAKWEKSPVGQVAKIVGDQAKPGPYIFLTKPLPTSGPATKPHTHPDNRTYTVISGTWYVGFGEKYDESKLIPLKAGSVYTEPAGVPHFVLIKDEGTTVQISGTGPSRLIPVGEAAKK